MGDCVGSDVAVAGISVEVAVGCVVDVAGRLVGVGGGKDVDEGSGVDDALGSAFAAPSLAADC